MSAVMVRKRNKMATIYARPNSNKLWISYRIGDERIRKTTGLDDTPENRRTLEKEVIPQLMAKIKLGQLAPKQSRLFKDYAKEYLRSKEKDKSYLQKLPTRKKVIAHFGSHRVDSITRMDVKRYLSSLTIKESSKRLYLSVIRGVLNDALDDEAVQTNVTLGIEMNREEKVEVLPFSHDEVIKILSMASGQLKNYLGIAFYTGMRSGEILGLMHHDIKESSISIKRSISKGKITTPKTLGSARTIPLFDKARPFIEAQLKESKSLYLFEYDGKPINDISIIRKRQWVKLLKDCEISYRKIYCTRHTFITAMLNSEKYKLLTIAKIVGHSSIKTLVENYAGFIKDEHLMIDCEVDIFEEKRHSIDTAEKRLKL